VGEGGGEGAERTPAGQSLHVLQGVGGTQKVTTTAGMMERSRKWHWLRARDSPGSPALPAWS